jgi:hypothetical protein
MRLALIPAETLETLRVPQHRTALRGQGDQLTRDLLLPRPTDRKDLLGFCTSRHAAQGGEAQRHASGILGVAHPMVLGHPAKRCDALGADRHANVLEPKGFGRCKLALKRGAQRSASSG